MDWKVAEAKQKFSDVVRRAAKEPQLIYNRDRRVAAVIDARSFGEFEAWRKQSGQASLADAFEELRRVAKEERYKLTLPRRKNRRNALLNVLDDVSS
ncbi:MAG: type II toxin-antitoxin system prevent-host-death family antitoxin [Betaproteobacteria bacterium]|nr:type II toxin-antitoxin system prevent-host-death family antitoxin [Betaproteobacteria bacterium]